MYLGFSASCWPSATRGSSGRKVPSSALRPGRPSSKDIVGVHWPKSAAALASSAAAAALLLLLFWLLFLLFWRPLMAAAEAEVAARKAMRRVLVCILLVGWNEWFVNEGM